MSIYSMTDTLKQKEINLYGSSRLGIYNVDIDVQNCNIASPEITKFTRGNKYYELSNHLGNVLATISDKHVQVAAPGNTVVDYYTAELITATDYYPFGMLMPQRQFYIDTTTYIVGTTSTEASAAIDTTVVELYKHNFSDTPSVHPYVTVPNVINANLSNSIWTNSRSSWTNYSSNTSMGKAIAFDNSTADTATVTLTLNIASGKKVGIKSFSFYNRVSNSGYRHWKMYINGIEVGDSLLYYPATGGTGNNTVKTTGTVQVKNAVEDITGSITVLLKLYDHDAAYPNGNAQGTFRMDDFVLNGYVNDDCGSSGSGYQYANRGGYRYGFGGAEKDNEIKGEGSSLDFKFRIYDPRLGRFLSVDKLTHSFPALSPYQYASNNPVEGIDLDGLEYVSSKQVRIEVIRGMVKLKVENMTTVVKNMLTAYNNDPKNWPAGSIGADFSIGHIGLSQTAPQAPSSDPDPSDANPNYRADQTEIGKPTAKSTGLPDKRYKDRTVTTASPGGAKGLAIAQVAMEVIMTGANLYVQNRIDKDESYIKRDIGFFKSAAADVNYALQKTNLIPPEFQTQERLSDIINVVLSGNSYLNSIGDEAGTKILEIGKNIYNTLSVKRNEYTGRTIETSRLDGISIKVPERNANYDAQYVKENPPLQ